MVTLLTYVCLAGATLGVLACLAIRYRRAIAVASDTICALSPVKKVALLIMLLIAVVHGGGKTNTQDNVDGGLTNLLTGAFRSLAHFISPADDVPRPPVTPADIAFGWQCMGPQANTNVCYAMPEGATLAINWWLRGAFEDVTPVSNLWAFTWGKVRFALNDTNEIVAVGAPMSAVPLSSRLWSATDTNGAFRITWEDFVLGRSNSLCSAQIEFLPNGDCITRSNEVETVWRHVNPIDFDGDGLPNDRDMSPYDWDGDFFGPDNTLPSGADEDAYCWIELRTVRDAAITFVGDGPSNLPDPDFLTCGGRTTRVTLLIGKTYDVVSDRPFEVVAKSDDRVEVSVLGTNRVEVVWPVEFTVAEGRAPVGRPLLGATWNQGGKSFYVMPNPPWLRGMVLWTDNFCCDDDPDAEGFCVQTSKLPLTRPVARVKVTFTLDGLVQTLRS